MIYIKKYWFFILLGLVIWALTGYIVQSSKYESVREEEVKNIVTKTDTALKKLDSLIVQIEETKKLTTKKYEGEKKVLREIIKKEKKKNKSSKPKTIIQTREKIVEKLVADPNVSEALKENYKIQQENCELKEEIIKYKTKEEYNIKNQAYKKEPIISDTLKQDTTNIPKKRKKRFVLF